MTLADAQKSKAAIASNDGRTSLVRIAAVSIALAACWPTAARPADQAGKDAGPPPDAPDSIASILPPPLATLGGFRPWLGERGVTFQLNYIGEALGDVSGGARRGAIYDGRLELVIDADLEKSLGWTGTAFHANGYQIHGTGLSRADVGNLLTVSNIEALSSTRLYEIWIEHKFGDKAALKVGQLGADTEFITSSYAGLFVNGAFGWPGITAIDLPSGGPAYPLATPGVRLALTPNDRVTVLAALFDGDPAGPGANDPQQRNAYGVNFRLSDAPLGFLEGQYKYGAADGAILPGTAKLGLWTHFGKFDDLRYGADGLSLANPASSGVASSHSGDVGVYGVLDQQIWRLPGKDATKGVGVFARVAGTPSDRNLVDVYADAGINFNGVISARPDDSFGLAFAYAHISDAAAGYDRDSNLYGVATPVRDYEAVIEASYLAQIAPGVTFQPDLRYVRHPGGNVANPYSATAQAIPDALVVGARFTIKY